MGLKTRANQLQTEIPTIFLALKDKRTPLRAKLTGAIVVGYLLSPIDLIPDFIPVLGYLDDVILLPVLITLTRKMIPEDIFEEYREKARTAWDGGKPKKWYYAIPIIIFWLVIIFLIGKTVYSVFEHEWSFQYWG